MAAIEELRAELARTTQVRIDACAVLDALSNKIDQLIVTSEGVVTEAQLQELVAQLRAENDALQAKVAEKQLLG